jgi:transposase-like protein
MDRNDRPANDARALARDLWRRGYSLRYIAGRLGVSERSVLRMVGPRAIARRASGGAR